MWLILTFAVLTLAILWFRRKLKYWERKGVAGPRPLPFVGNFGNLIIGKKSVFEIIGDIYREYKDYPFVGIYRMGVPTLLLRDPEIIKNVVVKDFSHFVNNDIFVDKDTDPLFGRNPFILNDEEWKKARHFLTPGFAPSKIKGFLPLVEGIGKNLATFIATKEGTALDAKDICGRFTCDAVAVCAFGIEGTCFQESNPQQLLHIVRSFVSPGSFQGIKFAIGFLLPSFIQIKWIPKSFDDNVIELTKDILKYRQEHNIQRDDYFAAMASQGSIMDIAGHLAGFIIDGFETTSTAMTFMVYELAANPECQKKLREEIIAVLENSKGELSYEALKDMVYLEACINESLRLHPPLAQLSKICTKKYTFSSTNDDFKHLSVTLEPGSSVVIPLLGLHKDPKYFPSPEKFMPERFLEKNETQKYIYLPFGTGPRACLGSRFGLLQSKIGLISLIKDFEITLSAKTRQPLKYDPFYFLVYPKGGVWINCKKIT